MKEYTIGKKTMSAEDVVRAARFAPIWFVLIAIATAVNYLCQFAGSKINFIVGSTFAHLTDHAYRNVIAHHSTNSPDATLVSVARAENFTLQFAVCLIFTLCWFYSKRGNTKWYLVGFILYAIDTGFTFAIHAWPALIFHVVLLFMIWTQFRMVKLRKDAEAAILAKSKPPIAPTESNPS